MGPNKIALIAATLAVTLHPALDLIPNIPAVSPAPAHYHKCCNRVKFKFMQLEVSSSLQLHLQGLKIKQLASDRWDGVIDYAVNDLCRFALE